MRDSRRGIAAHCGSHSGKSRAYFGSKIGRSPCIMQRPSHRLYPLIGCRGRDRESAVHRHHAFARILFEPLARSAEPAGEKRIQGYGSAWHPTIVSSFSGSIGKSGTGCENPGRQHAAPSSPTWSVRRDRWAQDRSPPARATRDRQGDRHRRRPWDQVADRFQCCELRCATTLATAFAHSRGWRRCQ